MPDDKRYNGSTNWATYELCSCLLNIKSLNRETHDIVRRNGGNSYTETDEKQKKRIRSHIGEEIANWAMHERIMDTSPHFTRDDFADVNWDEIAETFLA